MKKAMMFVLAAILGATMLTACGKSHGLIAGIDMSPYLNAVFRGMDGSGKARGDFDFTGFEEAVMAGQSADEFNLGSLVKFEMSLAVTVTPNEGLKNGDQVKVTASYDQEAAREAGFRITGANRTMTVKGLSGGQPTEEEQAALVEVDPFDPSVWNTERGISIWYSGIAPYGYLEIENHLPADDPRSMIDFECSEYKDLKEGDTVTMTAFWNRWEASQQYTMKQTTGSYTVGPIDHYLTDLSELDPDTLSAMQRTVEDRCLEKAGGFLEFRDGNDYVGFYNGEEVTVQSCLAGSPNEIYNRDGFIEILIFPCDLSVTVQEPDWMEDPQLYQYDLVYLCTVGDLVVQADGTVSYGNIEYWSAGVKDMEEALVEECRNN